MGAMIDRMIFMPPTPARYTDELEDLVVLRKARPVRKSVVASLVSALSSTSSSTATTPAAPLTDDLAVCFVKSPGSRHLLIYSHGNAEDLGSFRQLLVQIAYACQINVLGYDYYGYGLSSGKPNEANTYRSVNEVLDYATKSLGFAHSQIILMGRSLGSGPTTDLAARMSPPPLGVVLQSALQSAFRVGIKRTLPGDRFCNIDKVAKIRAPVFFVHGTHDTVVPFSHGQALHAKAQTAVAPLWITGANHNDIEMNFSHEYYTRLAAFVSSVIASAAGAPSVAPMP